MSRRTKVLAIAYACSPYLGSEPGVGWGWANAIAQYHDTYVITADFHRDDIERKISEAPDSYEHLHFFYVRSKPWHYRPSKGWIFIERSSFRLLLNYMYRSWQRDAFKLASRLNEENPFDIVHLVTMVGFRFPGFFWKINAPFVWGPIGGLENTPWRFLSLLGVRGFIYYSFRNVINSYHKRFLPGPKHAFRKARGGIIAATESIRSEIRHWYGEDSEVICEIGPPPTVALDYSLREECEPLDLSWSGQHVPGKALPLLLQSLATISADVDWRLNILGEGPCTAKWKKMAKDLGIAHACVWHGHLPRDEALQVVHESHLFVITSLKDLTSSVLLEALSQGVPVVCPDHCGFSNVVTDECGIKVPIRNPAQLVSGISSGISMLAANEEKRMLLAQGALKRAEDYSWEKKADRIKSIYSKVLRKEK